LGLFDTPGGGGSGSSAGLFNAPYSPPRERSRFKPRPVTAPGVPAIPGQTGGTSTSASKQLPPIIGLGQGILKALLTTGAASIEVVDEALKLGSKPLSESGKSAVTNPGRNVAALWGPRDIFEPGAWDDFKTGEDVLRDTLGVQEQSWSLPNPIGAAAIAGTSLFMNEEARKKGLGVFTGETEFPSVGLGTNLFWGGLGLDIATDPLTYGTLGISTVFRAGASLVANSAKGATLAAAGEVAEKLATRKAGEAVEIFNQRPVGVTKQLQRDGLQNIRNNIVRTDPKAAQVVKRAEEKLANNVYKTVRVTEPRTLSGAARDIVASGLDAGVKAVKSSVVSVNAARYLQQYAKRDVRMFPTRGLVANVVRNTETGGYKVVSGNKVTLAEAATKREAQDAARALQRGLQPATNFVPATAVAGARKAAEEPGKKAESVAVPSAEGPEITLERLTPHEADNGKVYVFDGDNIAEFDNLQDANTWVQIQTSPVAREAVEPVISGRSGAYKVRVGESITTFKTKKEANAYAAAIRTGEVEVPRVATRGGTPVVDAPPPPIALREIIEAPTKAEASALKKVLSGIDDVAKKASGWRPTVNKSVANQIRQILSKTQAQLDNFLMTLEPRQLNILQEFVRSDLNAKELFELLRDSGPKGVQLAKLIETIPVETTKGTMQFSEALKASKGNFLNMSKSIEGVEGAGLEAQVLAAIKNRFLDRAQQLKTRTVLPASDPEGRFQAIVAVAGETVAKQIQRTGYLEKQTPENAAKVKEILEQITSGSTEVSYQGYDDLIAGLRRGDEVSANVLDEIVTLIDPEGAIKASVTQAAAEPAAVYLTRLLTREGGVDTIYAAERRLAVARDPEMLLKHSNLSYLSEIASMIKILDSDQRLAVDGLQVASTRQAAAESFAEYPLAVQRDAMDSVGRAIMGDPKKGGAGGNLAYKAAILEEATGAVRTSTLGDEIYATGEAYADGSRAMFTKQLQQSDEVRIISSVLGKINARGVSKGVDRLDNLITQLSAARDGMGGLGFRFVRTKNRDDLAFQKSYNNAIQAAKQTKTTPNFSALSEKHTVYLPMADILTSLRNGGAVSALGKGFFPTGKVNLKRDVLDWYGLGDAARRVVEMDAAGEVIDLNEIAMRIMRRGASRELPSGRRLEILKEAANEIAEVLTTPEVISQLKAVHLDNAASIVKDFAQKAEDYSKALFDIMEEAWVAMHAADNLSEAARIEAVRLFFRKFVLTSDVMRIQGGPIAEAMFRASAMLFADGGKILPEGRIANLLTDSEKEFYNLLRNEEMQMFREAMTKFYRYADMPAAPLGREGMAPPKKAAQQKAQENLDTVMELYAKHMDELARIEVTGDLAVIKAWEKDMAKLQTRLNKAREDAWNKWVPTYHWHPIDGWVRTENFDHAKALASAKQAHAQYVAGKQGVDDLQLMVADTVPVVPPHRKLTSAEKAKFLAKHRKETTNALVENATSVIDDVSRNVADEVEAGVLNLDELSGTDKMMIAKQNIDARALKESTEIRLYTALSSYKDKLPESAAEFNRLFRPLLNEDTPVFQSDRIAAKLKLMAQRWSATSRGTSDIISVARTQENIATQVTSDYANAIEDLVRTMRGASADDIDAVWTALRDDVPLEAGGPAVRSQIEQRLAPFVNTILRSEATSVLSKQGIDGATLGEAFNRYGLNEAMGFPSLKELEGKTPEELVNALFSELPFGATPPKFKPGSTEAIQWAKRRERFRKSEMPPPLVFSRMFSAISQIKAEQGIAHNLVAQFGWKSSFKTIADAKAAGWVKVEAAGKQNIARFLPDADGGNLFHPQIAEDIGRVFREWNALYEGNALPAVLRSSMRLMGFLKFTQTTLRPGHHVVNLVGDSSNAIIFGATDPRFWSDAADISGRYTKLNFGADYAKFGRDFEAKSQRIVGSLADMPGAKMPTGPVGDDVSFTFYRDGKPSKVALNRDELAADMGRRGIMVPGFVQADIINSTNDVMLTGASANNKRSLSKIWSKVARPGHELMKGLSTATAAYSNIIRGATAMRVMQSRAWGSYEEMMNAVVKEVNLIHPTVQSLASSEKKWGRLLVTYYTWLRVAHNALWDMAVNHTGAMLAIPKAQYNYAQMQGFDPQSPAVPFESQNVLPDYLSYSVYGPTAMGPQGPRTYRPPMMVLDVLDFWKIWYDPSKDVSTNVAAMGRQLGQDVVGQSLNIVGRPVLEAVAGGVGGPRNFGEILEDGASNLGFMNLLTGLGLYTPYRYRREDTTNPLTEEDRKLRLDNWLKGGRAQDLYRPINVKLGQSQYGSRVKQFNERTRQENIQRTQQFVDGKLAEGYTREQIIEMLKQMGVR